METVILHDQRLDGEVEPGLGTVIKVDGSTSLSTAFKQVMNAAVSSDTELVIACHGYMSHEYDNASNIALRGGYGLQLCKESLVVGNVAKVADLQDYFIRIWLMACGPAGTIVSKNRPFCREFARYADAPVIASDTEQSYYPGDYDSVAQICKRTLRFGAWEGNVYQFNPDGTMVTLSDNMTLGSPLP
jgi:hypothetical protein